ncbi:MAG TPA: hypothetical protein ENK53_04245 [Thiotrichales bacterium]|nr:hypothetical protein [Thiotrichales bacterium]
MKRRSILLLLFFAASGLPAMPAHADVDENEIPEWAGGTPESRAWREAAPPPVAYPKSRDLIPVTGVAGLQSRVFVDGRQLTRGTDGVVRYLLVFRSPAGAESVFHEGMRCGARQWRRYAYGSHGRMHASPTDWRPLSRGHLVRLHRLLYETAFCPEGVNPPDAAEMRSRLRSQAATINDLTDE